MSDESAKKDTTVASKSGEDTVWVEGIVPGIDFCNHGKLQLLLLYINKVTLVLFIFDQLVLILHIRLGFFVMFLY